MQNLFNDLRENNLLFFYKFILLNLVIYILKTSKQIKLTLNII